MARKERKANEEDFKGGLLERLIRLETLAYVCFSIGNQAREEADDLMRERGLYIHDVKFFAKNLSKAFNMYNASMKTLYNNTKEQGMLFCEDYESVRAALYRFAGLEDKDPADHSAALNDTIEFGHIPDNDKC